MSVSYIPEKIKNLLWGKAAGRCQYTGCNKPLYIDLLTKAEFNISYIAHIIADKPDGPRGDIKLSEELKADISNLTLLCDEHHRLIDIGNVNGHPTEMLQEMKRKHEARIELLTSLKENMQSHILLFGAKIGEHNAPLSYDKAYEAIIPDRYPAERQPLVLGLSNSSYEDNEEKYWEFEKENLLRNFNDSAKPKLLHSEVKHLSIFGLAPQPLLIYLGRLLSDIPAAEIYQLHREPPNWKWQSFPPGFEYIINRPNDHYPTVAINLSLSATIDNSRITNVLGNQVSVWNITISNPNNDFMKSKKQLEIFRKFFRSLLNEIKAKHGENIEIHLFPAVPVSIAIEIGRVWMPKADLPIRIYDQNRKLGGFVYTFDIDKM